MTSTFTTEFGHEYEQERGRWLRRRFLWYAGVSIGLNLLGLLISLGAVVLILSFGLTISSAPDADNPTASLEDGSSLVSPGPAEPMGPGRTDADEQASAEPGTSDQGSAQTGVSEEQAERSQRALSFREIGRAHV